MRSKPRMNFWEGLGLGAMVAGALAMLTVTLLVAGSVGQPFTPEDAALWRLVARAAVSALALGAVALVLSAKLGRRW